MTTTTDWILILFHFLFPFGNCAIIQSFTLTNSTIPQKHQNLQLVCEGNGWTNLIYVKSPTGDQCYCDPLTGMCLPSVFHCSMNHDKTKVFANIFDAQRTDSGLWNCSTVINNSSSDYKNLSLVIYSIPSAISVENLSPESTSLGESDIDLVCQTVSCTYKDPVLSWNFQKGDGTIAPFTSVQATPWEVSSDCNDSEVIYKSKLHLPQNTTAHDNKDLTVRFQCQLSFSGFIFQLDSQLTPEVSFAVQVSVVYIRAESRNLQTGDVLNVTQEEQTALTCTTGPSRPTSTINWYIGSTKQNISGGSFAFIPQDAHHDKIVYCTAYNLQLETAAVESQKPKLYVKVQVSVVYIKARSSNLNTGDVLNVTKGEQTTLTCTTGASRPAATINWYIGKIKQNITGSRFAFIPQNAHHDKVVYCSAYNLQLETAAVVSQKPKLYVKVQVSDVYIKTGSTNLNTRDVLNVTKGEQTTLTCTTGASRPASTINWYIGKSKQNITGSNFAFIPQDAHHDKVVYCSAYNLQLEMAAVESQKPKLYVKVQVSVVKIRAGSSDLNLGDMLNVTMGEQTTLTCTTGTSRPESTINWYIGSTKQNITGRSFAFIPQDVHHNKVVYCTAYNLQLETAAVESQKPKLYVKVEAESPLIVNGTTFFDGDSYDVQCKSSATRPPANMAWILGSKALTDTTIRHDIENNGLVRVVSTVHLHASKPYHNAKIICQSWITGQGEKQETSKTVSIFWPPVKPRVTAVKEFPWVEYGEGELNCTSDDSGNPTSNITWYSDVNIHSGNQVLIKPLSYLDNNRSVKCKLENDFTLEYALDVISEEVWLDIQYAPKIFLKPAIFATRPEANITVTIAFMTNPKFTSVKLLDESPFNSSKYDLAIEEFYVEEDLNGNEVDQMGFKLDFTIVDLQERDFTTYMLKVVNIIGTANASFDITSESEPLRPASFILLNKAGAILTFYWAQGFNGGHPQAFWLQVTESHKDNWENKTIVDEFDSTNYLGNGSYIANITGLNAGTYSIRLIAANIRGQTEPVMLRSIVTIDLPGRVTEAFPVGAAAGVGVGAAVLIILGVIIFIVWKRRSNSPLTKDDSKKKILKPKRDPKKPDSADTAEVNINPMYESADTMQLPSNDVYAEVNKQSKQRQTGAPSDVYAQVVKQKGRAASGCHSGKEKKGKKETKETKNGRKGKPSEGTVYENASSPKDPDSLYENPACDISEETPRRTRNEDGLIYIDVELPQQNASKNQKPVIHGEDRTIYADVAYGKVGEQMPESDEETPKES